MEVVAPGLRLSAHGAQIRRDQLEAIALLDPQLAHLAKHRLPLGPAGQHGQHRHLVHQRRHFSGGHFGPHESGRAHQQIGDGFPAGFAEIEPLHPRAHALQHDEEPRARRVHADVLEQQLARVGEHRGGHEKRRGGDVPRNRESKGRDGLLEIGRRVGDRDAVHVQRQPQVDEQALGVIARTVRLAHGHGNAAGEPREQQGALHLGAGDGARVIEGTQPPATNRERQRIAPLFFYMRPHGPQRLGHAPHRPPPQ